MKPLVSLSNFISTLQVLWKEWDLRGFIVLSFLLQLTLILIAPFRKQTSNGLIVLSIWLSYLLADWVAVQAVGFIPKTPGNDTQRDLYAFWAQFLLVHLGGPDTITALALEDNELWLRSALQLGAQVYATFGVLLESIQQSNLWIATILMFFVGVIKYLERVRSLLHGRLTSSDDEPGYDEKLLKACEPRGDSQGSVTNVEMVRHAFYFFHYYKGMYNGQVFNNNDVRKTRSYFLSRSTEEVFRVLETELNFAYETFYTKTVIIHSKLGTVLRPIAMVLEVACLIIWCMSEKHGLHRYDIGITYTLLIGAIGIDMLAFFRIQLSNWNVARLTTESRIRSRFYNKVLSYWNRTWGRYKSKEEAPFSTCLRRAFFRRWSETVPQFNLIEFCVDKRSHLKQKAIEFFSLKDLLDKNRYVTKKWFFDDIRDVMYDRLQPGSLVTSRLAALQVFSRLDWSEWFKTYVSSKNMNPEAYGRFFHFKLEDTLIGWHILTEVCYRSEVRVPRVEEKGNLQTLSLSSLLSSPKRIFSNSLKKRQPGKTKDEEKDLEQESTNQDEGKHRVYREFSKVASDYMLYLLIWQPEALPISAGTSKTTFRDACASVEEILKSKPELIRKYKESEDINFDSYEGSTHLESPLSHALHIEEMLEPTMKMKTTEMWEFMAGLWVLVLCYTAKQCKPNFLGSKLKEGGELLSFVWLLIARLGLGQLVVH